MRRPHRFAFAVLILLALTPAQAQETGHVAHAGADSSHRCLDQKERRTAIENGRLVRLSAAIHAATSRAPGAVVRARLCHGDGGLVYLLTVLGRDGKVTRLTIDAVKGTLVGGL